MNKSKLFQKAHTIAKTLEGDYVARLSFGLVQAWKGLKGEEAMVIKHAKLGELQVEVSRSNIFVTVEGQRVPARLHQRNNQQALKFYKDIEVSIAPKPVGGLMITLEEYETIKDEKERKKKEAEEKEYQEWLQQKATYHTSYQFGSGAHNFDIETQRKVHEDLRDMEKDVDFGDYSISYDYDLTNAEIIKLLEKKQQQVDEENKLREQKNKEKIKSIFDKAKETGKRQVLSSWSEECNDINEECNIDNITEYAMPDGTVETVRNHTW